MHQTSRLLTASIALCVVVGLYFALTSSNTTAQENTKTSTNSGRFQISAWSNPAAPGSTAMHGAYIIDADSGKVWAIINESDPREIGNVKK